MTPTRIAIIDGGHIGKRHLKVLADNPAYRIAAIADPSPAAEIRANKHGAPISPTINACWMRCAPMG